MTAAALTPMSRFLAVLMAPIGAIKSAVARRQLVGDLARFDDHMLRDIGLTRGDVESALSGSLLDDPTLRLHHLAREARAARRAAASEELRWARMMGETEPRGPELDRRRAA